MTQNPRQPDPLLTALRRIRRRLAAHRLLRYAAVGLLAGATAACVWLVLTRLFPVLGESAAGNPVVVAGALAGIGLLAATGFAWSRRPTLTDSALAADRKLGFRERLTSSLELADAEGEMVDALHTDARARLGQLNVRQQFPVLPMSKSIKWLAAPIVAFGLLYAFLPEFDLFQQREQIAQAEAEKEIRAVHVERLKDAVRPLETEALDAAQLANFRAALDELAGDLESGEINEKQALARLTKLTDQLRNEREALENENAVPQLATNPDKLGMTRELASALQRGNMQEAARKAEELQKRLRENELTEAQKEQLAKEMSQLAKMLGGEHSQLGEALAEAMSTASEFLESGDEDAANEALEAMKISLEDFESILDQLEKLENVEFKLAQWKQGLLGPSEYCRICGASLGECEEGGQCDGSGGHKHHGICGTCAGSGFGPGMGGPGRGQGNEVGELPEIAAQFDPAKAPGPMTKGQMLANILQKTAPEEGEEATVEYVQGSFVQVQQAAEQALTQEEIPDASREFVRQYFGSLEPEEQ